MYECSSSSTFPLACGVGDFLILAILIAVECYLIVVLIYISLIAIDVEHLSCVCFASVYLLW